MSRTDFCSFSNADGLIKDLTGEQAAKIFKNLRE